MLAIRLSAGPDRLDTLVLPVRAAADTDGGDTPATLAPTGPALPDEVLSEATALLPAARLTGRAGETYAHLRPARHRRRRRPGLAGRRGGVDPRRQG